MKSKYVVVMVTTSSKEEAEKIVRCLLNEKLIACANMLSPVSSLFWWSNKVEEAEECLLFMKSRLDLFEKLSKRVKALHSYKVPEIIAMPIVKGFKPYMEWLDTSLR